MNLQSANLLCKWRNDVSLKESSTIDCGFLPIGIWNREWIVSPPASRLAAASYFHFMHWHCKKRSLKIPIIFDFFIFLDFGFPILDFLIFAHTFFYSTVLFGPVYGKTQISQIRSILCLKNKINNINFKAYSLSEYSPCLTSLESSGWLPALWWNGI